MINPIQLAVDDYGELRKVTWIPRQQMIASTIIVGILVVLVSLYISAADFLVAQFFGIFIRI